MLTTASPGTAIGQDSLTTGIYVASKLIGSNPPANL